MLESLWSLPHSASAKQTLSHRQLLMGTPALATHFQHSYPELSHSQ